MKEFGVQWLVKMVQYVEYSPQFMVNGFVKAWISKALDNHTVDLSSSEASSTSSDKTYSEESSDSEDSKGSTRRQGKYFWM